jgi:outer membrane protein assembly factor BamE (lipoprotein component of BamABCDE complex)
VLGARPRAAVLAEGVEPVIAGDFNDHMRIGGQSNRSTRRRAAVRAAAAALALGLLLGGCFSETFQRGYIVPDGALEQIPIGATQEQVLVVMGTPSTVATVSGEAFYYISQRAERAIGFLPQQVVDQRVIAVYFDKNRRVERLANYGLKDGRVFDFVSRTTPTGGKDFSYINAMFKIF